MIDVRPTLIRCGESYRHLAFPSTESMTYSQISQDNFNQVEMNCLGDGTSNVLVLNLSMPPWNLNFEGVLPNGATVDARAGSLTATATFSTNGTGQVILTLTFSSPPSATVPIGPAVTFQYTSA